MLKHYENMSAVYVYVKMECRMASVFFNVFSFETNGFSLFRDVFTRSANRGTVVNLPCQQHRRLGHKVYGVYIQPVYDLLGCPVHMLKAMFTSRRVLLTPEQEEHLDDKEDRCRGSSRVQR